MIAKVINIFIDTNIYLSFYRLSSEDLDRLEELTVLIKDTSDVTLYTTSQLCDEFNRNRDWQIAETLKSFNDFWENLPHLPFIKKYDEYRPYKEGHSNFLKEKARIKERIRINIENRELPPDTVIQALFEHSEKIEITQELVFQGRLRYDLWNPPGKKWSYWDAINWESLLKNFPNWEDLYFIGADWDYKSVLDRKKFNSFLEREWVEKKNSKIFYYEKLSDFLKEKFPQIGEMDEYIKDKKIDELLTSGSFNRSRQLLWSLEKIGNFSDNQLNRIAEHSLANDQIFNAQKYSPELIGEVLWRIITDRHRALNPKIYEKFCERFNIMKTLTYIEDGDDLICIEDIPF